MHFSLMRQASLAKKGFYGPEGMRTGVVGNGRIDPFDAEAPSAGAGTSRHWGWRRLFKPFAGSQYLDFS
ncbi:MAG: hypothetical protein ABFD98_04885 [Syntrophobacteraceae bacterium]|nr:hypothetical protein [Desulfobacteraceae bacterium]